MVYFLQEKRKNGFVKVGETGDLHERLGNLRQGNPYGFYVLATIHGNKSDSEDLEKRIKEEDLKEFRFRGEWFHPTPEVFEYIRNIQGVRLHKHIPEWRWSNLDLWHYLDD